MPTITPAEVPLAPVYIVVHTPTGPTLDGQPIDAALVGPQAAAHAAVQRRAEMHGHPVRLITTGSSTAS